MAALADQVSTFVRVSEALHWALLEGHSLTSEDQDLIAPAHGDTHESPHM